MKILGNFEHIFRCFFFCFFLYIYILNGVLDTKMEGRKLLLVNFLSDCYKGPFLKGEFAKSLRYLQPG